VAAIETLKITLTTRSACYEYVGFLTFAGLEFLTARGARLAGTGRVQSELVLVEGQCLIRWKEYVYVRL
jgi:hypothetical protein